MPLKIDSHSGDVIDVDSDGQQIVLRINGQATLLTFAEARRLITALKVAISVAEAVLLIHDDDDDFSSSAHKS